MVKEIKIVFPEISQISLGKINSYSAKDSMKVQTVVLYHADSKIDEPKLKAWMKEKMGEDVLVMKEAVPQSHP